MTSFDTDNLNAPPEAGGDISTEAVMRLLDGVTPGPWRYSDVTFTSAWGPSDALIHYTQNGPQAAANARFIAASRELVPALLSDRDRLAGEVARLRQEIANVQKVREHEHKRAEAALADVARLTAELAAAKTAVVKVKPLVGLYTKGSGYCRDDDHKISAWVGGDSGSSITITLADEEALPPEADDYPADDVLFPIIQGVWEKYILANIELAPPAITPEALEQVREALEFYAEGDWDSGCGCCQRNFSAETNPVEDEGDKARAALALLPKKDAGE